MLQFCHTVGCWSGKEVAGCCRLLLRGPQSLVILRPGVWAEGSVHLPGGPEPLSQLDAVHLFEQALGKKVRLDFLPVEAIQQQHGSSDPLQKTFAALMLAYAEGDIISGARAVAEEYGIQLRTVAEYALHLRAQQMHIA